MNYTVNEINDASSRVEEHKNVQEHTEVLQVSRTADSLILSPLKGDQNHKRNHKRFHSFLTPFVNPFAGYKYLGASGFVNAASSRPGIAWTLYGSTNDSNMGDIEAVQQHLRDPS